MALLQACSPDYNYDDLEYFEGYPRLTNESIGKLNYITSVYEENSVSSFPIAEFGLAEAPGMDDFTQYMLGFTALSVLTAAEHTPAYRKPYAELVDAVAQKMADPHLWEWWISSISGSENPIHPYNIMYTGHLQTIWAAHERLTGSGKYITNDINLTTRDGSQTWTTNLYDLSADIHNLILTNKDSQGNNYYTVACVKTSNGEFLIVWPACNVVAQQAFTLLPTELGQDPQAASEPFMAWLKENRVDPDHGYIYQIYNPDSEPPLFLEEKQGLYTAWTLLYSYAYDPEWVKNIAYPKFAASVPDYVAPGVARSYYYDYPLDGFTDAGGTAFGMLLTKQMGDMALYGDYLRGFESYMGTPKWRPGKPEQYGYFKWVPLPEYLPIILFRLCPNIFSLWADVLSPEINLLTMAQSPRGPEFYEEPYLADVTNSKVFVNQAIWDGSTLYITVNGAHVTTDPTDLVIQNLDAGRTYQVLRNDEVCLNWTRNGTEMTITTPALSGSETQRFQIIEQPAT
jgi:hypothetical protein